MYLSQIPLEPTLESFLLHNVTYINIELPPVLLDIYTWTSFDADAPSLSISALLPLSFQLAFQKKSPLWPWQPWTRYHTGHMCPFNGSWLDRQKSSSKIAYVCSLFPCFDACAKKPQRVAANNLLLNQGRKHIAFSLMSLHRALSHQQKQ